MTKRREYLSTPTRPFEVKPDSSLADVVERMSGISFQGRNLAAAFEIWREALADRCTVFLGLAGAMVPAGMRKVVAFLIEHRLIDCLVSTGANLYHDLHESVGFHHYIGSAHVRDEELFRENIDRIYDTFADDKEFVETDRFVARFAATLERRPYSTREFFHLLGKHLVETEKDDGILTAAYRRSLPVYCPAIGDSSIGLALAAEMAEGTQEFQFDVLRDVRETAEIALHSPATAVIYIGGGTPKNFIQQTEVTAELITGKREGMGHKYAIQFTADAPHWGGLSGCTFEEAQSWGKVQSEARKVSCFADATIVLPILVTALAQKMKGHTRPGVPAFEMGTSLGITFD